MNAKLMFIICAECFYDHNFEDIFTQINYETPNPTVNSYDLTFLQTHSYGNDINRETGVNHINTHDFTFSNDLERQSNKYASFNFIKSDSSNSISNVEQFVINNFVFVDNSRNFYDSINCQNYNFNQNENFIDQKSEQNKIFNDNFLNQTQDFVLNGNTDSPNIHTSVLYSNKDIITNSFENSNLIECKDQSDFKYLHEDSLPDSLNNNDYEISKKVMLEQPKIDEYENMRDAVKKLKMMIPMLNMLQKYEKRFLKLKISDDVNRSVLLKILEDLKKAIAYTKDICERWIKKEEYIENSLNNRFALAMLMKLGSDIKSIINVFAKLSSSKFRTYTAERGVALMNSIEKIERDIERLRLLEFDKILGNENSKKVFNENTRKQSIKFIFENDDGIQSRDILVKMKFYPVSLALFKEYAFLCIYSTNQYMKILKIDLTTWQIQEIDEYTFEERNQTKHQRFGFGSKFTIIKTDCSGKIFLLKSPLKGSFSNRSDAQRTFEMIVLDQNFSKLTSIAIDSVDFGKEQSQPAFPDFAIHNDLVYALDVKFRCIKIFNDLLVILRTIPFPQNLTAINTIHLAVSSKYIFVSTSKIIYYIENSDMVTEFKSIELKKTVFNIACYGEEIIIIRFVDEISLLKINEISWDLENIQLPSLDQLKGLFLTTFIIEENAIYSVCRISHQVYKLIFALNSATRADQ